LPFGAFSRKEKKGFYEENEKALRKAQRIN